MSSSIRLLLPALFLLLAGCAGPDPKITGGADVLSRKKFLKWQAADEEYLLLDVRSPQEYASGHIRDAKNLPYMEVVHVIDKLSDWRDGKIILYDETGRRSAMTAKALLTSGFQYVYVLEGHLEKWRENGGRLE